MICIDCQKPTTQVANSRPNKKYPQVWRRRHCEACGIHFTTQEKPVLDGNSYVLNEKTGEKTLFYQGKIIHSIEKSFAHDEEFGVRNALPLSETVIGTLALHSQALSNEIIGNACFNVLSRFDQAAATQYAIAHGIIAPPHRRRKSAR